MKTALKVFLIIPIIILSISSLVPVVWFISIPALILDGITLHRVNNKMIHRPALIVFHFLSFNILLGILLCCYNEKYYNEQYEIKKYGRVISGNSKRVVQTQPTQPVASSTNQPSEAVKFVSEETTYVVSYDENAQQYEVPIEKKKWLKSSIISTIFAGSVLAVTLFSQLLSLIPFISQLILLVSTLSWPLTIAALILGIISVKKKANPLGLILSIITLVILIVVSIINVVVYISVFTTVIWPYILMIIGMIFGSADYSDDYYYYIVKLLMDFRF